MLSIRNKSGISSNYWVFVSELKKVLRTDKFQEVSCTRKMAMLYIKSMFALEAKMLKVVKMFYLQLLSSRQTSATMVCESWLIDATNAYQVFQIRKPVFVLFKN